MKKIGFLFILVLVIIGITGWLLYASRGIDLKDDKVIQKIKYADMIIIKDEDEKELEADDIDYLISIINNSDEVLEEVELDATKMRINIFKDKDLIYSIHSWSSGYIGLGGKKYKVSDRDMAKYASIISTDN